jgi:hypothetical protein
VKLVFLGEPCTGVFAGVPRGARAARAVTYRLAVLAALLGVGCGRQATVEDCDRIVQRITELELGNSVQGDELGSEVAQTQKLLHDQALSRCVGRHITQAALDCVARATTADQIVNSCFD